MSKLAEKNPFPKESPTLKVWLALFYLYFAWGSTYVALRFVVQYIPPLFTSGLRTFLAGVFLFFLGRFIAKDKFPNRKDLIHTGIIGLLIITLANGLVSVVAKWVPSGFSAMITSLVPIWIVLLQWFWGTKPNKLTVLGLFLGLIGVLMLVTIHNIAINNNESKFALSIFFLLIAGLAWAVGVMLQTKAAMPYSSFTISGIQLAVGGGVSLILSFFIEDFGLYHLNTVSDFIHLPLVAYKGFGYLMLIGSIGGFAIFNWVSQQANPTLVSTYTYVNPLVAICLGNIFFDEKFHVQMLLAGFMIIVSVIVISYAKKK